MHDGVGSVMDTTVATVSLSHNYVERLRLILSSALTSMFMIKTSWDLSITLRKLSLRKAHDAPPSPRELPSLQEVSLFQEALTHFNVR